MRSPMCLPEGPRLRLQNPKPGTRNNDSRNGCATVQRLRLSCDIVILPVMQSRVGCVTVLRLRLSCDTGILPVVTAVRRPAEAGLVKAALKRTHSRDSGATCEFGVRNFSSALTSGLQHRGLRQLSSGVTLFSNRRKKGRRWRESTRYNGTAHRVSG